jgi:hypothetical protein
VWNLGCQADIQPAKTQELLGPLSKPIKKSNNSPKTNSSFRKLPVQASSAVYFEQCSSPISRCNVQCRLWAKHSAFQTEQSPAPPQRPIHKS